MPKLLTFPELREHGVLMSRRQVDREEMAGRFPKRVPTSSHRVAWVGVEIDGHVKQAIDSRSLVLGELGSRTTVPA